MSDKETVNPAILKVPEWRAETSPCLLEEQLS